MKYITEFRDPILAKALVSAIEAEVDPHRQYHLMEFCGGHTHTIHRYGIPSLLPKNIELLHGPGCPVCVLPIARLDQAIALASMPNLIFCSYGDMLRVPGTQQNTLWKAKARGADVRMIYSVDDALQIAKDNPAQDVVFFAIGFETTTPPTAYAILQAEKMRLSNFSVFCNHVLTPVAMESLLQADEVSVDGFIGPAHVSIVIGSKPYETVALKYQKPVVISGFEPLDVLHSILMLVKQINERRSTVEVQYTRAVTPSGNDKSQQMIHDVFVLHEKFEWRGLGYIPHSAMQIHQRFEAFDAEKRFILPVVAGEEHKQCLCGAVLRGVKKPTDCQLFEKLCTPDNPLGSCMVSSEGACAAVYAYARGASA